MRYLVVAAALAATGCVRHIYPYSPKVRAYEPDAYAPSDAARTSGSLWGEGAQSLFEDARARRVGDILTVHVDERSDATRDAATNTSRNSQVTLGITAFWTAMKQLASRNPNLDPAALIAGSGDSDFKGSGSTSRSGQLTAVLPVRIKKVLPNGDFYVEGTKVLLLNDDEGYLYMSGVVRPIDIDPDNSVPSSVIADVQLEYTGRGVLAERQSPGWLARIFDYIWPF